MKASQGLGFAFEGEDDGLNRQLSTTVKGFRSLEDMMPGMAKTFQSVGEGAGALKERFQGAYGSLSALTTGGTLTTGLEGQIVSLNKDLRKMGVNAGLSGKALTSFKSKSMGMSLGMKISAEEAGDAVKGWMGASSELKAVGIDSAQTLAKFANVSGMSASETVSYLKDLRKEFQFTDEDLKSVTQASMAMGQATGDVAGAMKDQAKTLQLLRDKARGFGQDLPTKELAKFAAGNAKLATMFYSVSGNADEARESANAFSTTVLKARTDWLGSFAGMGGGFEGMFQEVGMSVGDIGVAMDSMKQGPDEFIQTMAKMVQSAKKNGKDIARPLAFMQAHMDKAFDPATSAKMTALFRNATDESLASMAATDKATDSLGEYAKKGFTAGWTLDESFTRAKETLDMSFRSIGRSAATNLVKNSGKSFKAFSNDLKDMASKGGPIGTVITKLSEMSSIGGLALLPEKLRPMGALFGTMSEKMGPVIGQLQQAGALAGHLGVNMGTLGKIFSVKGLLLTGALAFGTYLYTLSDSGTGAAKVLAKISDTAANLFEVVSTAFEKVPEILDSADKLLGQFFNGLEKGASSGEVKSRWVGIVTRLAKGFAAIIVKAAGMLKEAVVGFWQGLTGTFNAQSASGVAQLGNAFGQGLRAAWDFAVDFVKTTVWPAIGNFAMGFWDAITGTIDPAVDATGSGKVGAAIGSALKGAWNWAVGYVETEVWPGIQNFVRGLWDALTGNIDPAKDTTGAARVGVAIGDAITYAVNWITDTAYPALQQGMRDFSSGIWSGIWRYLTDSDDASTASSGAKGFGEKVAVAVSSVASGLAGKIGDTIADAPWKLGPLGLVITPFVDSAEEDAAEDRAAALVARMQEKMSAGMRDSQSRLSGNLQDKLLAAGQAAMLKETEFAASTAEGIDKRWREKAAKDMETQLSHLDEVNAAWRQEFGMTTEQAAIAMKKSLDDGTFALKNSSLEAKGYLKSLKTDFEYTAEELRQKSADFQRTGSFIVGMFGVTDEQKAQIEAGYKGLVGGVDAIVAERDKKRADEFHNAFEAQVAASQKAYAERKAAADKLAGIQPAPPLGVPQRKGGKGKPIVPVTPGVPAIPGAPEEPSFKYNKEEYKGYRDMISQETAKVAKHLDKPTQKLVGDVLNAAFLDAYGKIDLKTKEFADKETKVLGKLATDVKAAMGDMWITVLKQTAIATEAMTKDVTYIASQLKTVESAFVAMNAARSAAATTTATDMPDLTGSRFKAGASYEDKMLEALRWPDWYEEYRKTFADLVAAVVALKSAGVVAPVGGTYTPASVKAGGDVTALVPKPPNSARPTVKK